MASALSFASSASAAPSGPTAAVTPPSPLPADTKLPVAQGSQGQGPAAPAAVPNLGSVPVVTPALVQQTGYNPKTSTVASRAATSTTYANTDGTQTVVLSPGTVNFQNAHGAWAPVDNSIVADPDRVGGLSNAANGWRVHFGTTTQGVSVDTAAGSVSVTPVGAAVGVAPVTSATPDGVTYANAWPGADLTYTVAGDAVKETVLIKSASAGSSFAFATRTGTKSAVLGGSAAPTPVLSTQPITAGTASDGLALPGALGTIVHLDAPVVVDAQGVPIPEAGATLTSVAGQVVLSVDPSWLASQPVSAFPIRLDPTIGIAQGTEYSWRSNGYSCTNCSSGMQVGNSRSSGDTYWRSIVSYNTTALAGTQVLYSEIDGSYITGTTNADPLQVYSPNNYTYAGCVGGGQIGSGNFKGGVPLTGSGLTTFLQNTANANSATAVLGFAGSEVAGLYTYQGFSTALYVNINHKPTVAGITAPSPANGASYHQSTFTFAASASDADGDPLQYYFRVATGADAETNTVYNSGWVSSTSVSWTVPSSLWNTTLYWHVYAFDGNWQTNPNYVWSFKSIDTPPNPAVQMSGSTPVALPGNGAVVASPTPTLSVPTATDPDGDAVIYDFTISGGGDAPGGRASSGWISSPSWMVPSGVLADGQSYSWSVATNDGTAAALGLSTAATWSNSLTVNQRLGTSSVSPSDALAGVSVNLANGNATVSVAAHTVNTVAGALGVGFTYNSQAAVRNGLLGQYYADPDGAFNFATAGPLVLARVDPTLNMFWNQGSYAAAPPGLPSSYYLVKWTGYITAPVTGSYQLGLQNDDGARIYLNHSTTATPNNWGTLNTTSTPTWAAATTLTAGVPVPIEIDYYQVTGPAQLSLSVQGAGTTTLAAQLVPSSWLTPTVSTLPAGWSLSLPGGAAGYTHAAISAPSGASPGSVTLTDGEGASHTYIATAAGGYTPPVDEDGVLSKDGNGNLRLADDDGSFYTFDANGNPLTAQSATDTLHPAAATYLYDTATSPRVKTVTDPVSGQAITLTYANSNTMGGASCPTPPGTYDTLAMLAPNVLCQVSYWDGTVTNLYYYQGQLAAVLDSVTIPAGAGPTITQFGYGNGLLTSVESPLAADWGAAGNTITATATTVIGYTWVKSDVSGSANIRPAFVAATMTGGVYPAGSIPMVTSVTAPAPDGITSANSPQHTYDYTAGIGEAKIHIAGDSAGSVDRDVTIDPLSGRTLSDTHTGAETTTTAWAPGGQDLPTSSTDAAGRKTTTIYDWAMRASDTYGPAPAACFQASGLPLTTLPGGCITAPATAIPHTHTGYDTDTSGNRTPGLETSYWNNIQQSGPPTARLTAASSAGNFYASQPSGNAAAPSSEQLTGELSLPAAAAPAGTSYTFSAAVGDPTNDGVRVFVNNQPVINRWTTLQQAVTTDAPSENWQLTDPAGATSAANTVSGQPAGTPTAVTFGGAGPDSSDPRSIAPTFNGTTSKISAASATAVPGAGLISVEAWIKPANTGTYQMIVTKDLSNGATNDQFELRLNPTGQLQFLQANSTSFYQATSAATITFGSAWQHVVATKDGGGNVKLYLNGNPDTGTVLYPGGATVFPATIPANTEPVLIGAREDGNYFTGQIADVALYSSVLSNTQIATHYQGGTSTLTGTATANFQPAASTAGLPAGAGAPQTLRVDYRNPAAAASFTLKSSTGGVTTTIPDSAFDPRYGLATYSKTDDSGGISGAAETTATSYTGNAAGTYSSGGLDPVYGLATDSIVDPAGLALDSKTAYEAPGSPTGYLRPTAHGLPSASLSTPAQTTASTYYAAGQTQDVSTACPGDPSSAVNQAGLAWVTTNPAPASGAAVATEVIYDTAGQVVASRIQGDGNNWTCTSYDARGRVTKVIYPAVNGAAARTVTKNYAVGGNPLVTSVSDSTGTITATVDLLGRVTAYTDANGVTTATGYDQASRDTSDITTAPGGGTSTVTTTYNDDSTVTSVKLDGAVIALPTYDAAGQLSTVSYPSGTGNAGNGGSLSSITYNPQGHQSATTFTLPGTGQNVGDTVTMSQAGRVMTETSSVNGATSAAWTYSYDTAARLSAANLATAGSRPAVAYAYGYTGSGGCGADTSAGLDSARVSQSTTIGAGSPAITTSCTDYASRLTSATGAAPVSSLTYNGHGDATGLVQAVGTEAYTYDSADRVTAMVTASGSQRVTYTLDAANRMTSRVATGTGTGADNSTTTYGYTGSGDTADLELNATNGIGERYLSLPGGVLLTRRYTTTGGDIWSIPNLHGDVTATTGPTGTLTSSGYLYDPYGQPLDASTGVTAPTSAPATATNGPTVAWEGSHQRGYENANGLNAALLGARLYLPTWGQFGATDPVAGGNANPYVYPDDPINNSDLTGQWSWKKAWKFAKKAYSGVIQVATLPTYAYYYGNYLAARQINRFGSRFGLAGRIASHIAAAPFVLPQVAGLAGDMAWDVTKGEPMDDENKSGCTLPLHSDTGICGPYVHLYGVHHGYRGVDIAW